MMEPEPHILQDIRHSLFNRSPPPPPARSQMSSHEGFHRSAFNKPTPLRSQTSLHEKPLPKSHEKATQTSQETQAAKNVIYAKRWRLQCMPLNIERDVSEVKGLKEKKPLKKFCTYILKKDKKNELIICLIKPKSSSWFKQFYFVKHETLKRVTETNSINARRAIKDLGPGYGILYDENTIKKSPKIKPKPVVSQKTKPTKKVQEELSEDWSDEETEEVEDWTEELDEEDDDDEEEEEEEEQNDEETEDEEPVVENKRIKQKPTPKPKKIPEKHRETEVFYPRQNNSFAVTPIVEKWDLQRELLSRWILRIFRGESIEAIKKEIGKKNDAKLAWIFQENLEFLKKARYDDYSFDRKCQDNLRKRQYEVLSEDSSSSSEEEEKPKKVLVKASQGIKKTVNIPQKRKFNNIKKSPKREKTHNPNPTEHEILADSVAFYKSAPHFNRAIRSLPLFQKELRAFEETLTPGEVKTIEDAMDTGFNPIHYIYQYKLGEKTLLNVRGGIYKKCVNSPSLEIIYKYLAEHVQVPDKIFETENENENNKENTDNLLQKYLP